MNDEQGRAAPADSLYWLDTLWQDVRYGARVLRRAPRFTVAVVLVLGLGVGVTTAVFAIVDSLVLNAVPFAESQRLVELYRWGPIGGGPWQPAAMVESWRTEKTLFDGVEPYDHVERVFTGGREPETMQGGQVFPGRLSFGELDADGTRIDQGLVTPNYVSGRYFPAAGIPMLQGRGFDENGAGQDVAVVSRALADRLWPSGGAVGKRFRMPGVRWLNDGDWLTVVGVAGSVHADGFDLDRPDPYEIYLPWSSEADVPGPPRGSWAPWR